MNLSILQLKWLALKISNPESLAADLTSACAGYQIELYPYQISAALFAIERLSSGGVILADEVGLGKTIEAGIVISHLWAEQQRNILVVAPLMLLRQWEGKLSACFDLPCRVIDSSSLQQMDKSDYLNAFKVCNNQPSIIITSYETAARCSEHISAMRWNLVVMDEVHRLRNMYQRSRDNIASNRHLVLLQALEGSPKLMLTATPMQNRVADIVAITSFINPYLLSDVDFKQGTLGQIKSQLQYYCRRNLRGPLIETGQLRMCNRYVHLIAVSSMDPPEQLQYVNELIDHFCLNFYSVEIFALIRITLYRLWGSSTRILRGFFSKFCQSAQPSANLLEHTRLESEEFDAELQQHMTLALKDDVDIDAVTVLAEEIMDALKLITPEPKLDMLIQRLPELFSDLKSRGRPEKIIIFTCFKETQQLLLEQLITFVGESHVLTLNGSNDCAQSQAVFERWWREVKHYNPKVAKSQVNVREAITWYFKEHGKILIATDAASEGLNLQFCCTLINYDLTWNPQSLEQRIGRVHRIGQLHDVSIINMQNSDNMAERHMLNLIDLKLGLFNQIFDASDEIAGKTGTLGLYEAHLAQLKKCRTPAELAGFFNKALEEYKPLQQGQEQSVRLKMHTYLNQEIASRFDFSQFVDEQQVYFQRLKQFVSGFATHYAVPISVQGNRFCHQSVWYELSHNDASMELFKSGHPLFEQWVTKAIDDPITAVTVRFTPDVFNVSVAGQLDDVLRRTGKIYLQLVHLNSLYETRSLVVLIAKTDADEFLLSLELDLLMQAPVIEIANSNVLSSTFPDPKITTQHPAVIEALKQYQILKSHEEERAQVTFDLQTKRIKHEVDAALKARDAASIKLMSLQPESSEYTKLQDKVAQLSQSVITLNDEFQAKMTNIRNIYQRRMAEINQLFEVSISLEPVGVMHWVN